MTKEYIEREEALSAIKQAFEKGERPSLYIKSIPAADVAPVRHGQWISLTDCANAGVYCSECKKKVWKEDYAPCNRKNKLRSRFCPNCGAKMDVEEV